MSASQKKIFATNFPLCKKGYLFVYIWLVFILNIYRIWMEAQLYERYIFNLMLLLMMILMMIKMMMMMLREREKRESGALFQICCLLLWPQSDDFWISQNLQLHWRNTVNINMIIISLNFEFLTGRPWTNFCFIGKICWFSYINCIYSISGIFS